MIYDPPMRYEILHDARSDRLERRVAEAIAFGWEPCGGVSVAMYYGDQLHFAQAMTLRETQPHQQDTSK